MLLYKPNAVLGIRSGSHFFYQCTGSKETTIVHKNWNHHTKGISPRCDVGRRSAVIITLSKIDDSISQYMSGIESSEI